MQRGHNRNACFREVSDYLTYLAHLRHGSRKYGCALHAYCLMTNHVHLLLTPETAEACGRLMHDLGTAYVRYFNKRYARSGTLWEGRYHSCIAESAHYVLAVYRYIELNPVRAGMVSHAGNYGWSSHQANTGKLVDPSLTPHAEFGALSAAAYEGLFGTPLDADLIGEIREATRTGYPLASEAFKVRLDGKTQPGKRGPRVGPAVTKITNPSPN
ncbi:MAG: transposase [Betaproteobacteria bacterium]